MAIKRIIFEEVHYIQDTQSTRNDAGKRKKKTGQKEEPGRKEPELK